MKPRENKGQEASSELARALARWDNEGGVVQLERDGQATLGDVEEKILQCLGAAVIVQWNDLPTEIQRQLFQDAVSMGEPRNASQLKEEIARFLHNHKDDEAAADRASDRTRSPGQVRGSKGDQGPPASNG